MAGVFGLGKEAKMAGRLYDGWLLFISEFPYIDDGTQSTIFRCLFFPCGSVVPSLWYTKNGFAITLYSQSCEFKNL